VIGEVEVSEEEAPPRALQQGAGVGEQVSVNDAYGKGACYEVIDERKAEAVSPPCRGVKVWQPGTCAALPPSRGENLQALRAKGRFHWKEESGPYRHSLVETALFRLKTIFGLILRSRQHATELFLKAAALSRVRLLHMPDVY
jgi:hypothetical protein